LGSRLLFEQEPVFMNDSIEWAAAPETPAGQPVWHRLSAEQATRVLDSNPVLGLSTREAARRHVHHGANRIFDSRRRQAWRLVLDQFADVMILVLIAAAVLSGIMGDVKDAAVILVIVLLNAVVGLIQAVRADQAILALRRMSPASAKVLRDGRLHSIRASRLVPGDVVILEAGAVVPADLRLLDVAQLKIEEASLTGESAAVEKTTRMLADADLAIGDRTNLAFKGTAVTSGRGRGIVIAIGMRTELGRIATLLDAQSGPMTPLQRRLALFGKRLAVAVVAVCAIVFALGLLRGEPPTLMFLTAVSLAVAAIPEALPAVVTICLALGARRLAAANALVRRLPAVETLGSITTICSDKTGTLTRNRMEVVTLFANGESTREIGARSSHQPWSALYEAMALNNDVGAGIHGGDPTEIALLEAATKAGIDRPSLDRKMPRVGELPFDAERRRMLTLHQCGDAVIAVAKGSPEQIVSLCDHVSTNAGEIPIDRAELLEAAENMASDGLRVLALARRRWPGRVDLDRPDRIEMDMVFLGLAGLEDPARPEVAEAVQLCRSAGITPVIVSGDHPATASAIARQLGMLEAGEGIMTGRELAAIDDATLRAVVADIHVFARVDPAQKIRIVEALQARGEIVAMTGDGVNDAPALNRADIGVAMGRIGTDVAREASSMILLDDNFASIVSAVAEGRRIFDNIRKFIRYTMSSNVGEILVLLLAPFFGLPVPLLPIHILWINLLTDGLPGLALAAEPAEPDLMRRPPRDPREGVFARGMWKYMIAVGLLMAATTLLAQAVAIRQQSPHWQTMVFTVLTLSQMGHVLAIRSERSSILKIGLFSNLPVLGAVMFALAAQLATIYVPALNPIFRTMPLSAGELILCLGFSSVVVAGVEAEKWMSSKGWIRAWHDDPGRQHHPAAGADPSRSSDCSGTEVPPASLAADRNQRKPARLPASTRGRD
jgi:P-type Ca2+ transporter type 2C